MSDRPQQLERHELLEQASQYACARAGSFLGRGAAHAEVEEEVAR
jgi:hypothetical protein